MHNRKPISLLVCALGGEGGGVLTEWLVEVARAAGYAAQATSIPGVAQRTGATTYYIEVFPVPMGELAGRRPVFSLNPVPGALDAIVSSELLETARQVGNGMASPERTLVVSSSSRVLTTLERMQLADGRAESETLLKLVRQFSRRHHVFDMAAAARDAGTIVSAVMLGAVAAAGIFPFSREQYEAVVKASGTAAAASLRGFAAGYEQVRRPGHDAAAAMAAPLAVRDIAALAHERLVEYQDAAYAELYRQRLQAVVDAEQAADPQGAGAGAIALETARWLALWMAFDDIVRVADLKSRAARWDRVRRETRAADDDLLKVYDHFKPGAPEFAALLPAPLAQRVLAWDRRRTAPWALPLKVGTHSVFGMLALRALASLKWLRPRGSRYALEQEMIERWLGAIVAGTRRSWRLGHEIALCGRLVKGYGSTNERGKENLLHVLDHLAHGADAGKAADAIAAARAAALADDAGQALDATLVQHGAPPRAVKPQPIRWMRKPPRTA